MSEKVEQVPKNVGKFKKIFIGFLFVLSILIFLIAVLGASIILSLMFLESLYARAILPTSPVNMKNIKFFTDLYENKETILFIPIAIFSLMLIPSLYSLFKSFKSMFFPIAFMVFRLIFIAVAVLSLLLFVFYEYIFAFYLSNDIIFGKIEISESGLDVSVENFITTSYAVLFTIILFIPTATIILVFDFIISPWRMGELKKIAYNEHMEIGNKSKLLQNRYKKYLHYRNMVIKTFSIIICSVILLSPMAMLFESTSIVFNKCEIYDQLEKSKKINPDFFTPKELTDEEKLDIKNQTWIESYLGKVSESSHIINSFVDNPKLEESCAPAEQSKQTPEPSTPTAVPKKDTPTTNPSLSPSKTQ